MMNQNFKKQKNFFYLLGTMLFLVLLITTAKYTLGVFTNKPKSKDSVIVESKKAESGIQKIMAGSFQEYVMQLCKIDENDNNNLKVENAPFKLDLNNLIISSQEDDQVKCGNAIDDREVSSGMKIKKGYFLQVAIFNSIDKSKDKFNNGSKIYFHDGIFRDEGHDGQSFYMKVGDLIEKKYDYEMYLYFEVSSNSDSNGRSYFYRKPYLRAIKTLNNSNGFTYYASYSLKLFDNNKIFDFQEKCAQDPDAYCLRKDSTEVFKEKYLNSNDPDVVDALAKVDKVMNAIDTN